MSKNIKLKVKDRKKLVEMYERAQTTPCIKLRSDMQDFSTMAWNDVAKYMDELGETYGFDPKKIKGIDSSTGEVLLP